VSLIFLDLEASSLSSQSYPIEIGCAWIENDRVVQVSDLIRPDLSWPPDWSRESEAVHGILLDALEHAEPERGSPISAHPRSTERPRGRSSRM
jgi:DNA polymerase III subunit epsilon